MRMLAVLSFAVRADDPQYRITGPDMRRRENPGNGRLDTGFTFHPPGKKPAASSRHNSSSAASVRPECDLFGKHVMREHPSDKLVNPGFSKTSVRCCRARTPGHQHHKWRRNPDSGPCQCCAISKTAIRAYVVAVKVGGLDILSFHRHVRHPRVDRDCPPWCAPTNWASAYRCRETYSASALLYSRRPR